MTKKKKLNMQANFLICEPDTEILVLFEMSKNLMKH